MNEGTVERVEAAQIARQDVSKSYGGAQPAVEALTLGVRAGQFVALLGPSGVLLLVRPEALHVEEDLQGPALVQACRFFGAYQLLELCLPDGSIIEARLAPQRRVAPHTRVAVRIDEPVTAYPA